MPGILLDASNPFFDPNIIELVNGIKSAMQGMSLVTVAKEMASALALIYIAVRAYAMIAGEGRLEVIPLFRPFLINLVILNMGAFTSILSYPGRQAEGIMKTSFEANAQLINELQDEKVLLNDRMIERLYTTADSAKAREHLANEDDWTASLENAVADIGIDLTLYARLATLKLQLMFTDVITRATIGVFKGVAYCLFFITAIILIILSVIGPIAMALSIAGAFKDSWIHWAGKVISVSFYNAIGFIVLNVSCAILDYGFQQENDRLRQITETISQEDFINKVIHLDSYIGYLFIAIIVAIAGVGCTPLISTWFISTQGGGGFASAMARAPTQFMNSATKALGGGRR
jgi:hypothetical protein